MKKIVLFLSVLFTLALTSCEKRDFDVNDPTPYCFKITLSSSYEGKTYTSFNYGWGTGAEANQVIDIMKTEAEKMGFKNNRVSIEKTNLTQSLCEEYASMGPY